MDIGTQVRISYKAKLHCYIVIAILLQPEGLFDAFEVVSWPQRITHTCCITSRQFLPRWQIVPSGPLACVDKFMQEILELVIKCIDVFDRDTLVSGEVEHARVFTFDAEDFIG